MGKANQYDLLVVGGGPAGASAAHWAAKAGMSVAVVEKKSFPRDKTCGDGLTPRAIRQLDDMGLLGELTDAHRHIGLRARANKYVLELEWPDHPEFPNYGLSLKRSQLDQLVLQKTAAQGAEIHTETEAVAPLVEDGTLKGAVVKKSQVEDQIRAKWIIVADGANSRFGRALGTKRNRNWPQGMAIRTYYKSSKHNDNWLESDLDIRSKTGESLPGYGWIFPLGDGTINVGVGILSTFKNYTSINTSRLMEDWADAVHPDWEIDPQSPCIAPVGGRLPMGGSVEPKAGPNWMIVGDAAGFVNPFNGEGIDYAYETGRKAAELLTSNDLASTNSAPTNQLIVSYPVWLQETYGLYFQVARAFAKIIGNPTIIKSLIGLGMRSRTLMEWALRIMANLLRPDELGPAEAAYKAIAGVIKITSPRYPARPVSSIGVGG